MRRTFFVLSTVVTGVIFALIMPLQSRAQELAGQTSALASTGAGAELPDAPDQPGHTAAHSSAHPGDVSGTVTDTNGGVVPGATVLIEGTTPPDRRSQAANDNGFFEFKNVAPNISYRLTVNANG